MPPLPSRQRPVPKISMSARRRAKLYSKWEKTKGATEAVDATGGPAINATGNPSIDVSLSTPPDITHFAASVDADRVSAQVWVAIDNMVKAVEEVYNIPDSPVPPCLLKGAQMRPPEAWLDDTGARYDMVGKNSFPKNDPSVFKGARPTKREINLFTGNGIAKVKTELPLYSEALGEEVAPMLMENSPPALATGERCWEKG